MSVSSTMPIPNSPTFQSFQFIRAANKKGLKDFKLPNIDSNNTDSITNKDEFLISDITDRLNEFKIYDIAHFDNELSVGPSTSVIDIVTEIVPELVRNELIPERITPSIEEGLCLVFSKDELNIYVEFYNDGDIGIIAENSIQKKVLINEDISEEEVITKIQTVLS